MFMLFISPKTSSSQRVLGLPVGVLHMRFHLLILLYHQYTLLLAGPSGHALYGRSPAEIVGSNRAGGIDVCLL